MKFIINFFSGLAGIALLIVIYAGLMRQREDDEKNGTNYTWYIVGLIAFISLLQTCNDKE